jgi:mono/diheme cytochrome c family protein
MRTLSFLAGALVVAAVAATVTAVIAQALPASAPVPPASGPGAIADAAASIASSPAAAAVGPGPASTGAQASASGFPSDRPAGIPVLADASPPGAAPAASAPPAISVPADEAPPVERGRYLAAAGDCEACHTREGGAPYAGGRPIATPFGTVLSANLTPDATGLGNWNADQFYRALHEGIAANGEHLFPAFPYNWFTRMPRADTDAIFAYLRTLAPVANRPDRNQLSFPFNIRALTAVWNYLYLDARTFVADPGKSAQWNRGAYLVQGPGHCGACHTPKTILGGPRAGHELQGGEFAKWFAPDLTPNQRSGLGGWTRDDLVRFLRTGRNAHASAAVEMGLAVTDSTSRLGDADLLAIATYLADRPASPTVTPTAPPPVQMREGEAIFVDECSACHRMQAGGAPEAFPPLKASANAQQRDPTTMLHFILAGVRSTPTAANPTPFTMPAFAWKLSDAQVAAVATYVRNSWGNAAPAVDASQVEKLRGKLSFDRAATPRSTPTPMSRPGPNTWSNAGTDSRDNGTPHAGRPASAASGP